MNIKLTKTQLAYIKGAAEDSAKADSGIMSSAAKKSLDNNEKLKSKLRIFFGRN